MTIARLSTPTEANLLRGVLGAAGIQAIVADAHLVQAHSWMTQAVGGVRVQVPASVEKAALETVARFNAGEFALESEDSAPNTTEIARSHIRLWGPDAAALWSFWLTPVFGCFIHYFNSKHLNHAKLSRNAKIWLVLSIAITTGCLYIALSVRWEVTSIFMASSMASAFTAVWYIFSGYQQSKHIARTYGTRYVKRRMLVPWFSAIFIIFLLGSGGELLG